MKKLFIAIFIMIFISSCGVDLYPTRGYVDIDYRYRNPRVYNRIPYRNEYDLRYKNPNRFRYQPYRRYRHF